MDTSSLEENLRAEEAQLNKLRAETDVSELNASITKLEAEKAAVSARCESRIGHLLFSYFHRMTELSSAMKKLNKEAEARSSLNLKRKDRDAKEANFKTRSVEACSLLNPALT